MDTAVSWFRFIVTPNINSSGDVEVQSFSDCIKRGIGHRALAAARGERRWAESGVTAKTGNRVVLHIDLGKTKFTFR